jgi:hypothetical protein
MAQLRGWLALTAVNAPFGGGIGCSSSYSESSSSKLQHTNAASALRMAHARS